MCLRTPEKIRNLQRKLYLKAKKEPEYRFYSLYDKICREDVLAYAYALVRSKRGAPGVDGQTFEQIEQQGLTKWLKGLREELCAKQYKCGPVRRVYIPKPNGGERPLGIPNIRDRVVQAAAVLVLGPIFEADFCDGLYGYRPKRSARDAVKAVHKALKEGFTNVLDADLSKYFDTIPHEDLMKSVARRISDGAVLKLIRQWLKAPIEERDKAGRVKRTGGRGNRKGTPQGGVISPLLSNIYMNRFHRAWRDRNMGKRLQARIVGYADDFVILCRGPAHKAYDLTRRWLHSMKLTLNEEKTCVRDATRETFDFLGYTFGPTIHRPTGRRYIAAQPSRKSVTRLRQRIRETLKETCVKPWPEVVERVNGILRGWANYFSYGTVSRAYWWVDAFVLEAARRFLVRRHKLYGRGVRRFPPQKVFGEKGLLCLGAARRAGSFRTP